MRFSKKVIVVRSVIHPGGQLADELRELGMSAAELASRIAVPVNRITQIMNGRRAIPADTAVRLGHWFDTGPEIWLNLQQLYELRRVGRLSGRRSGACRNGQRQRSRRWRMRWGG